MTAWVHRLGRHGEHQHEFLETSRLYLTWDVLQEQNLSAAKDFTAIRGLIENAQPSASVAKVSNHAGQVFAFVFKAQKGDTVVCPLSGAAAVAVGEITGDYIFDPSAKFMYRHSRSVKWLATDVPRSRFDAELRQSFCGMKTFFEIKAKDADQRIRAEGLSGASHPGTPDSGKDTTMKPEPQVLLDLERKGYDDIADLILRKFKGRGLERLVEAILAAQGYTTYRSPDGPDRGVDILAAPGPLGFGAPRICVQVKCTEGPIDQPTLSQLLGTMQNVKAQQGLLVSWGGFKTSVDRVRADHFFTVRLWDQDDVIREMLAHYDRLDEDIKAELPLKRIWIVNPAAEE